MTTSNKNVILVTGATSGIGKSISLSLGTEGNTIIATGRSKKALASLKKEITAQGGRAHTYSVDLSNPKTTVAFCKKVKSKFKTIHWIVYCAGIIDPKESFAYMKERTLQEVFEVNLFSVFRTTAALLPIMKEGGFISISSTAGLWGNGRKPIYSASKGALIAYGKSLAWHLKDKGELSSIVICPGPTNTPMRQKIAGDAQKHQSPQVIAEVVKKIVDGKSEYKNGDVISVHNGTDSLESRLT